LFVYLIYLTSPQIKQFKDTLSKMIYRYQFKKIMQYNQNKIPNKGIYPLPLPTMCYPPPYRRGIPTRTGGMMLFVKFFWEIFLGQILGPFFKNFFSSIFLGKILGGCFLKKNFWEIFGLFF